VPVPLNEEVSVWYCPSAAVSFTVKVAVSVPTTLGVKVTLMLHEVPAAKLVGRVPQVFVCEKSPALAPVNPMLPMLTGVNSLLCKVKFTALLGMLRATLPKLYEPGVSVTSATPVPLSDEVSAWY
jgi:hypothetical protein